MLWEVIRMIRFFNLLRKFKCLKITSYDMYLKYIRDFNPCEFSCPVCRAKHPGWKRHDDYGRYIISFENGKSIVYHVEIIRYECSSCGHTHALLPEFLVPYRSYSIFFILSVLKEYFSKSLTILKICEKYDISVSTLYS